MTADLPGDLRAAVIELAQTPHLLVALDFDGTMAPIVDRAEDARPLPRSAAALAALSALERTTTALVSGRALASLRVVAAPPEPTLLVGSHGAEVHLGPSSAELKPSLRQATALAEARAAVAQAVALYPGTMAEQKPAGVVLHYRQASETDGQAAVDLVNQELAQNPAFTITTGKMVLEISVVSANKGEGLATLRESTHATATFFAGDDVTDEHAFAALLPGDVGVKVGQGNTCAHFRIESPHQLPAVLELLLAARTNGGTHNA
ncbi:trehalose-phosphatase [Arthrobacter glacialis]|uniref:Trehalose 6-phosphate phosphatase n=1 Tax=Arthrobacter glacialis TaxID=1664 RepID=A0A2S3ZRG7_ARTGL|nr:trehalose-phosphatase [Arthrobacter glacialis]POH71773.1 trehalose-phosphatase [Arthrobacter glacialis]